VEAIEQEILSGMNSHHTLFWASCFGFSWHYLFLNGTW